MADMTKAVLLTGLFMPLFSLGYHGALLDAKSLAVSYITLHIKSSFRIRPDTGNCLQQ